MTSRLVLGHMVDLVLPPLAETIFVTVFWKVVSYSESLYKSTFVLNEDLVLSILATKTKFSFWKVYAQFGDPWLKHKAKLCSCYWKLTRDILLKMMIELPVVTIRFVLRIFLLLIHPRPEDALLYHQTNTNILQGAEYIKTCNVKKMLSPQKSLKYIIWIVEITPECI